MADSNTATNTATNTTTNIANVINNQYNNIIIEYPSQTTEVNEFNKYNIDNIDNINDNTSFKNTNISILPIPIINELNKIEMDKTDSEKNDLDNEIEEINVKAYYKYYYKTCYNCERINSTFTILYDDSCREFCDDCYSERLHDEYEADEYERYLEGISLDRKLRLTEYGEM